MRNCPEMRRAEGDAAQSEGDAWYSILMSKAFTKEAEGGEVYDDLPDRPVSPHNIVTSKGLEMIEAELARLHREHAAAQDADDRPRLAKINRDLRYWTSRRATAQVAEPPRDAKHVQFGSTVTMLREDGRRQTYRIVGEDEADPSLGTLSYVSPVAQALLGKEVGDTVQAGVADAEIVAIA
jgi:transcription elongation GreA/GreB family factor